MNEPLDYRPAWYRAACTSDCCRQGHKPCPTPDACRISDEDSDFGAIGAITTVWPWLIKAWALIAAIALFFWVMTT